MVKVADVVGVPLGCGQAHPKYAVHGQSEVHRRPRQVAYQRVDLLLPRHPAACHSDVPCRATPDPREIVVTTSSQRDVLSR